LARGGRKSTSGSDKKRKVSEKRFARTNRVLLLGKKKRVKEPSIWEGETVLGPTYARLFRNWKKRRKGELGVNGNGQPVNVEKQARVEGMRERKIPRVKDPLVASGWGDKDIIKGSRGRVGKNPIEG